MSHGIRFLDIRYGYKKGIYIDQHGPVEGKPFMDNFDEIKWYLGEHPNEFICIKMQAEEKLSEEEKKDFVG